VTSVPQRYAAPPIIEAVVELRLKAPLATAAVAKMAKRYVSAYDQHQETGEVDFRVRLEGGKVEPTVSAPRPVHLFSSRDQTDRLRIETTKLHWSKFPPYEGWPEFLERIVRDTDRLPKGMSFPALERIGVRYRNRIDVPGDPGHIFRYEEYLSVNIDLPPLLDPNNAYAWRIEKLFSDRNLGATVMSGLMQPELPDTIAVLLDIDVGAKDDLPSSKDDLVEKLNAMRILKNQIFEACVTDKARASFA
jgi:uncharacterized protein (TIGR04255 family)